MPLDSERLYPPLVPSSYSLVIAIAMRILKISIRETRALLFSVSWRWTPCYVEKKDKIGGWINESGLATGGSGLEVEGPTVGDASDKQGDFIRRG
ncbi:hypothetical protein ACLOJK_033148 [Asimina triloba]